MADQAENNIDTQHEFRIDTKDGDICEGIKITPQGVLYQGVEAQRIIAERMHGSPQPVVAFANGNPFDLRRCNIVVQRVHETVASEPAEERFVALYQGYERKSSSNGDRYHAKIYNNKKGYSLGTYSTEEHAAIAYDLARRQLYGKKACVNFPKSRYLTELADVTLRSWMQQHAKYYGDLDKKCGLGMKQKTIKEREASPSRVRTLEILPFTKPETTAQHQSQPQPQHQPQPQPVLLQKSSVQPEIQPMKYFMSCQDMAAELGISYNYLREYIKHGILPKPTPNSRGLDYYDQEGQKACLECKATGRGVNGLPFVPRPPRPRKT